MSKSKVTRSALLVPASIAFFMCLVYANLADGELEAIKVYVVLCALLLFLILLEQCTRGEE